MFEFMAAVETDNETAEKFSAYTLRTPPDGPYKCEDVMVYGMPAESRFVQGIPKSEKGQDPRILISSAYSDKYDIFAGDTIELQEKYGADKYRFTVAGVYDYPASICVFMEQSALNQCFDLGKDYFSGYMSQTPITDIDEKYIGTEIDFESLTKVTRQLTISMGSMMYLVDFFAVAIFLVLIYILSKIIIEKNAQSISMAKILGYTGGEIGRLYIRSTTVVYLACFAATVPIVTVLIRYLMKVMIRMEMTGWIDLYVGRPVYVEMIILGVRSKHQMKRHKKRKCLVKLIAAVLSASLVISLAGCSGSSASQNENQTAGAESGQSTDMNATGSAAAQEVVFHPPVDTPTVIPEEKEETVYVKAARDAEHSYNNFSGILDGQKGSVRFVIETEEIEADD